MKNSLALTSILSIIIALHGCDSSKTKKNSYDNNQDSHNKTFSNHPSSSKYFSLNVGGLDSCDYSLNRIAYFSCFDSQLKIPRLVAYKLTRDNVKKRRVRLKRFYADKDIPKPFRVSSYHYTNSGYHRGHMMPNAVSDWDKAVQKESFLMTNIFPQAGKFNTGAWKNLESFVRSEVLRVGELSIINGLIPSKKWIRKKGLSINIPSKTFKIITYPNLKSVCFIYPNKNSVLRNSWNSPKYKTDLKQLSKMTLFTFL